MTRDGVPWNEMQWTGSHTDPIDAVLAGSDEREDLLDVAAMVHDLQATYLRAAPLRRSPELVAFTEGDLNAEHDLVGAGVVSGAGELGVPNNQPSGRNTRPMWKGLTTFVGTIAGKIVLGAAVAAASAGTLHAANVVDVPALPDPSPAADQPAAEPAEGTPNTGRGETPDHAGGDVGGTGTAEANREAAAAYTDAVQDWTDCVSEAAAGQGDAETRTTGGFDPTDACGEKPQPADYGLNEPPPQASEAPGGGTSNAPADPGPPETPGDNAPTEAPGQGPSEQTTPTTPTTPTAPNRPDPSTPTQANDAAPDDAGRPQGRP